MLYMGLISLPSKGLGDSSAENNVDYGGPDQEVSEENNVSNWIRDYSCVIFGKDCGCFLFMAKLKSSGPIYLVEEILQQPNMTRESYGKNVDGEGCRRGGHWPFLEVIQEW